MGIGGMRGTTGKNDNTGPKREEPQLEPPSHSSAQSPWRAHPATLSSLPLAPAPQKLEHSCSFSALGKGSQVTHPLCISGCWNRGIFHALSCFSMISSSHTIPWPLLVPHVFISPLPPFSFQALGPSAPWLAPFIPLASSPPQLHMLILSSSLGTAGSIRSFISVLPVQKLLTQSCSLQLFEEELTVSLYPSISLLKVLLCTVNPTSVSHKGFLVRL